MRRTVFLLLFLPLLFGIDAAAEPQEPAITVAVYDRAAMKAETLLAGEREAGRILSLAGVPVHWLNCRTVPGGVGDDCLATMSNNTLVLTIVARSHSALKTEEMGYAFNGNETGSWCSIFRSRVDEISAFAHVSVTRLLGAAIAHELGHLVKGLDSHSEEGVMSAHWRKREIQAVSRGALIFTKTDTERIQKRLRQTSSVSLQRESSAAQ